MKKLIIIPTYNERTNIKDLITKIFSLKIKDLEVLVVDDNSPDGTSDIVKSLKTRYNVHLITRKQRLGLGTAYLAGFDFGIKMNYDLIFTMDADLSHNPGYLSDFLKKIEEGYDVVIGSRYIGDGKIVNWGILRKLMSKTANTLTRILLNINVHDVTSGYRCYKKEVLKRISLGSIKSNGYSFLEEILYLCKLTGAKIGETPIIFMDRKHGKSKLKRIEIVKFFITLFRLLFSRR